MTISGAEPFRSPQIVLLTQDFRRATEFYKALGYVEGLGTPQQRDRMHTDLRLDGYLVGLAEEEWTRERHGLGPLGGQHAAMTLWTDDAVAGYRRLVRLGAQPVKEPAPWLDDLLIAWVKDPDGHLIEVTQNLPEDRK